MRCRVGIRLALIALAACSCCFFAGCEQHGRRSGRGLYLPDGDAARGAVAFHELGCATCHGIAGEPESVRASAGAPEPPEALILGGPVTRVETYGELVTSIIHPEHEISRSSGDGGLLAEMPVANERMTVIQLIDLVAFLQSTYEERPLPNYVR